MTYTEEQDFKYSPEWMVLESASENPRSYLGAFPWLYEKFYFSSALLSHPGKSEWGDTLTFSVPVSCSDIVWVPVCCLQVPPWKWGPAPDFPSWMPICKRAVHPLMTPCPCKGKGRLRLAKVQQDRRRWRGPQILLRFLLQVVHSFIFSCFDRHFANFYTVPERTKLWLTFHDLGNWFHIQG